MKITLKTRMIVIYTGIALLLVAVIGAYAYTKYEKLLFQRTIESYSQSFTQMQENLTYKIALYKNFTHQIAKAPLLSEIMQDERQDVKQLGFAEKRFENCETLKTMIDISALGTPSVQSVYIYHSAAGVPTDGYYLLEEALLYNEPFYKDMMENNRQSGWYQQTLNGKDYLLYAVPIFRTLGQMGDFRRYDYDSSHLGLVVVRFSASEFDDILQQVNAPGTTVTLRDDNLFLERQNGEYQPAHARDVTLSATLDDSITLTLHLPYRSIKSEIFTINKDVILMSAAVFLLAVALTVISSRMLIRRVYQLKTKVQLIRDGQMDSLYDIGGNDEITELDAGLNEMVRRNQRLIEDIRRHEREKKEAELRYLQIQINPHFLYNTLNAIKNSIDLGYSKNATEMLSALTNYYRAGLNRGMDLISLENEMKHAEAYIVIQKFRTDYDFEVFWSIPEELLPVQIIKGVLQPLIENSIQHGFARKKTGGVIEVFAQLANRRLCLMVYDNGSGVDEEQLEELNRLMALGQADAGFGLHNVNQRLKNQYGADSRLRFASRQNRWFFAYFYIEERLLKQ